MRGRTESVTDAGIAKADTWTDGEDPSLSTEARHEHRGSENLIHYSQSSKPSSNPLSTATRHPSIDMPTPKGLFIPPPGWTEYVDVDL